MSLAIAALHGNRAHAPASSLAAFVSACTSGATLIGLEVRASKQGEPFVIGRAIGDLDGAAIRAIDLGDSFVVDGGKEQPWAREVPIAKVQSLGAMLDAVPEDVELLLTVPDLGDRAALRAAIVELLRRRGLLARAWLAIDSGETAAAWGKGDDLRTAATLTGDALGAWLASPGSPGLVLATQADVTGGAAGHRTLRAPRAAGGKLLVTLDDDLDDAGLREAVEVLAGAADAVAFRSTLRLADAVHAWRTLEKQSFAGEEESASRIHFGYAKANRYGHVFQHDGVHVKLAPYTGRKEFGDEADATEAALSRLQERMFYAMKDWPFYSGGGLGTAFGLDGDFSAEVDFTWATAAQATMCEMAVINVDPSKHRPGWITDAGGAKVANPPASFRDKNAFFDPHGCPPFVGVERDEDDGWRINWNLGTDYDNNQYGRPHGNGKSMGGRLRLDRRGPWFAAYYRDADNPDWVSVGTCRNDSLNRRVYLRCVCKRWRQENPAGAGFLPIPEQEVVFRNLLIRLRLS